MAREKHLSANEIRSRPSRAQAEYDRLGKEITELESMLAGMNGVCQDNVNKPESAENLTPAGITNNSNPDHKMALFQSLFRGRNDICAKRWTGRDGKSGYSPA